jgi:hypothetical protein
MAAIGSHHPTLLVLATGQAWDDQWIQWILYFHD